MLPFTPISSTENEPNDDGSWNPPITDTEPKVNIPVSDETTPIKSVQVPDDGTDNIATVTVTVKDKDGNEVVSIVKIHFCENQIVLSLSSPLFFCFSQVSAAAHFMAGCKVILMMLQISALLLPVFNSAV